MENKKDLNEKMHQVLDELIEINTPQAFMVITVGEDLMVNYAMFGMDADGAIELLTHTIEYVKQVKGTEDEYGRDKETRLH